MATRRTRTTKQQTVDPMGKQPTTSPRRTRQQTRQYLSTAVLSSNSQSLSLESGTPVNTQKSTVKSLPSALDRKLTGLTTQELALLKLKQRWLAKYQIQLPEVAGSTLQAAADATLAFSQEEAGTAICISPLGLLLTCSHCVADTHEELSDSKTKWLIFASGQVVQAECIAWDPARDLALLRIVASQSQTHTLVSDAITDSSFPHACIARSAPRIRTPLACIGHPGSVDLEASQPGIRTNYGVLHASTGSFRGYAKGQDLQNNSEIGALKHDCWTYWGHSGAPLVEQATGNLIGLHSSWDDMTGMRRGVPLEAIWEFLTIHSPQLKIGVVVI